MKPWKIHVLYEYGLDLRPYGSAYLRLLRPLSHPAIASQVQVTSGLSYTGQTVDLVIVDRLWRPDISLELAVSLVEQVRAAGARLVYALDDNLHDLAPEQLDRPLERRFEILDYFLAQADAIWVTTPALKERVSAYSRCIITLPNALDERLLVNNRWFQDASPFGEARVVIGYMGTYTHDDDLGMVLPALTDICARFPGRVSLELIGAIGKPETFQLMAGLPYRVINLLPGESEYPLFQLWFTGRVRWDIAIAPLLDTPFNRCKSDVKYLDYCAISTPGIYSRVAPYQDSVQHKITGWLAENTAEGWVQALENLIQEPELRSYLGTNATQYLYKERTLANCASHWIEAIETVMAR